MDIPIDYIYGKGFHEVGHYFEKMIKSQFLNKKVAVTYTDFSDSIIYVTCDKIGNPQKTYWEFITIMGHLPIMMDEEAPCLDQTQVYRKCVQIKEPLIYFSVPSETNYIYGDVYKFLWRGEIMDKQEIPIEQLDVKYLMILAQEAIKKREPIILDEVIKNKLIK